MKAIRVPRLKPGQGVKGPDALGCFNSGFEPVIFRPRHWPDVYLVGPYLQVLDHKVEAIASGKRRWGKGPSAIYVYRTRAAAVRQFRRLCEAQLAENRREAEEIRQARAEVAEAVKRGDYEASLHAANKLYGLTQ